MLTVGYAPRVHTHGKIILACNRAGDLRRGADWLDMLLETESPDFARRKSARLFDKVLLGAAMRADEGVFHEAWAKMRAVEAVPTEGTLEAFLLMESKIGTSPSVEAVWSHDAFAHLREPRSPKLHLRRVEAHARVATFLIRSRDASRGGRGGGKGRDASVVGADVRAAVHDATRDARAAAAEARRFADAALDELYARVGEATSFTTKVSKPKDVRDATTAVCGAYSVVGDSNRVRELMEAASSGQAPSRICTSSTRCFDPKRRIETTTVKARMNRTNSTRTIRTTSTRIVSPTRTTRTRARRRRVAAPPRITIPKSNAR